MSNWPARKEKRPWSVHGAGYKYGRIPVAKLFSRAMFRKYFEPDAPASFSGQRAFLKQFGSRKQKEKAKAWLNQQEAYAIHKPVIRKFKRTPIVSGGLFQNFEADLIDLSKIRSHNKGHNFLLTVIDVFSKKADARPLKTKSARAVEDGLKSIFDNWVNPRFLRTDQGREFKNAIVQDFLKSRKIKFYNTFDTEIKASVIERFNKTLQGKLFRYFTKNKTREYLDVLPKLVKSYNNSYHSSIGTTPNSVNPQNSEKIWNRLYNKHIPYKNPQFKVGDLIRLSKSRRTFDKGYLPRWSKELFSIKKINLTRPVSYTVQDLANEEIKGIFYHAELLKAKAPSYWDIEKILETKQTKKGKIYLVKWDGYPNKFNSWTKDLKLT